MSSEKYTIGVDFGTLSGRALVVRVDDGHELASAEHAYAHGVLTDSLPGSDVRLPNGARLTVEAFQAAAAAGNGAGTSAARGRRGHGHCGRRPAFEYRRRGGHRGG